MFEAMLKRAGTRASWRDGMPGVRVCEFDGPAPEEAPLCLEPGRFEAVFCQEGALKVRMRDGRQVFLRRRGILLLSSVFQIRTAQFEGERFRGMLVTVDAGTAGESLERLCGLLGGLTLGLDRVSARLDAYGGCACIGGDAWSEAVFAVLEALPPENRGEYGALKTVELFYLLCHGGPVLAGEPLGRYCDHYQADRVRQVYEYVREHLEDDLSIAALARRFRLSQTVLKERFRQVYGLSLHRCVSECRLERAAELLTETAMPVAHVAAQVGYSSVSQFGTMFRRRFGLTPGQYQREKKNV